jgi:hypothetical protein
VFAGTSSILLEVDDEVWQFPRTPVWVIARRTRSGYKLVGRALIFKWGDGTGYGSEETLV